MIMSVLVTMLGILYTVSTLMMPAAKIGNPQEPKIFPLLLGIALLLLGVLLVLEEIRNRPKMDTEKTEAKKSLEFGPAEQSIVWTILNGVLYTVLFDRIGYVFSTFLFLSLELIIFRGKKGWLQSLLIAVIFSVLAFVLFNTALGVYLPTSFLSII
jgi:putative tricarboxylic transport membrane protein